MTGVARLAAVIAAAVMVALALFQLGLAAGLPWGKLAWGGGQAVLSPGFRAASAISIVVWVGAALIVLRYSGFRLWAPLPAGWLKAAVWIFAGYTALGIFVNAISRSPIERAVMTPVCAVLAVTCALVALRSTAT